MLESLVLEDMHSMDSSCGGPALFPTSFYCFGGSRSLSSIFLIETIALSGIAAASWRLFLFFGKVYLFILKNAKIIPSRKLC
jgi:hypothetical protein